MMTRKEYMDGCTGKTDAERTALHRAYYAQLVNASTIAYVVSYIGAEALLHSTDPHLNDIRLSKWDSATYQMPLATTFKALEDSAALGGLVCVAKEAARQWIEAQQRSKE